MWEADEGYDASQTNIVCIILMKRNCVFTDEGVG